MVMVAAVAPESIGGGAAEARLALGVEQRHSSSVYLPHARRSSIQSALRHVGCSAGGSWSKCLGERCEQRPARTNTRRAKGKLRLLHRRDAALKVGR
jgi:hypothetical protein